MNTAARPAVNYERLERQLDGLIADEPDFMANAANFAALLYHELPDVNWVGFYWLHDDTLVLGSFQGLPACTRIALGSGVCGTAAATRETQLVDDVHAFPGHIACDAASESEIVIPLIADGRVLGVLDIDSPHRARFDAHDRAGLEALARRLLSRAPSS